MKKLLFVLAFAASCKAAYAQVPVPPCWPLVSNASYKGSELWVGSGPQCRWAAWMCVPVDPALPTITTTFAGLKSENPFTTILGRALTLDSTIDSQKATIYELMWKTYIKAPIPDVCAAEIAAVLK